jgi:ferredoxin-nitrite reductase
VTDRAEPRPGRSSSPFALADAGATSPGLAFVTPTRERGQLNEQERLKLERHPFAVAAAVVDRYAVEGPEALASIPGELDRLKWVGVYPQRQGGDAFMMRVKVPGGALEARQARVLGEVAEEFGTGPHDHPLFGNHYADLTTRQSVQLHWLHLADIPEIWRRFDRVGLTSVQACGDCARNVTCCPVSGVARDEVLDALGAAREISAFFTGNWTYSNLPRKFKISVSGCTGGCVGGQINDVALEPARHGDEVGFNVLVGGGLSDGERLASDIDLFVARSDAVELCRAIAQLYGELGNRENRGIARMRYLVEELGPATFRDELVQRLAFTPRCGAEHLAGGPRRDHVGIHSERRDGFNTVGLVVPVGRLTGGQLIEAARLAETYGDGMLRIGVDQNLHLSGVADDRVQGLLGEELAAAFSADVGPFTRGVVACTGNEFCRYAVTETKQQAVQLARRLDATIAGLGVLPALGGDTIRLHVSGCSASCAQPQIADVGLRGAVHKGEHALLEGYDVGFGGSLGDDAGFLDWVEGAVAVDELHDALVRTVVAFAADRDGVESFASWSRRVGVESLRTTVNGTDR